MNIKKNNIFKINNPKINFIFVLGLLLFIISFNIIPLIANENNFNENIVSKNVNYHKVRIFNYEKISNKLFEIDLECSEKDNFDLITILNDKEIEYLNLVNIDYKIIIENYNIKLKQDLSKNGDFNNYFEKLKLEKNYNNFYNNPTNKSIYTSNDEQNYININELILESFPNNFRFGNFYNYHLLDEIYNNFDQMQKLYPQFINKRVIGYTHNKRPIYLWNFNFGDKNLSNKKVLFTALHHSREPITASGLIYSFWWLLENYKSDNESISTEIAKLLENNNIYIVPCVNPDGYIINNMYDKTGLWRKNAKVIDNKVVGVDINRNYGPKTFWDYPNPDGSSTYIHAETYRGEKEFSEPETIALQKLCLENNFTSNINFHSFGNLNIIPNLSLKGTNQSILFEKLFLNTYFNTKYLFGTDSITVGYTTRGTAEDWMNQTLDKSNSIFSYTPELDDMFYQVDSTKLIIGLQNCLRSIINNLKITSKFPIINKYELINNNPLTLKLYLDNIGFEAFENFNVELEKNITKEVIKPINDFKKTLSQNETNIILIEFDNFELNQADTIAFIKIYDNNNLIETIKIKQNFNEYKSNNLLNPSNIIFDKNFMKNNFVTYKKNNRIDLDSTNWGINFQSEKSYLSESKDTSYSNSEETILEFKNDFVLKNKNNYELIIKAEWLIERRHDCFIIRLFDSINNRYLYLESEFSNKRRFYENGSLTTTEYPLLEGYFPDNNILRFNLSKVRINYKYKLQFVFISDNSKNYDGMKIFNVDLIEYLPNQTLSLLSEIDINKSKNIITKSIIKKTNNSLSINEINTLFNVEYNSFEEFEIRVFNLLGEVIFSNNINSNRYFSKFENGTNLNCSFTKFIDNLLTKEYQKQIIFINFKPINKFNKLNKSVNISNTINSNNIENMNLKILVE